VNVQTQTDDGAPILARINPRFAQGQRIQVDFLRRAVHTFDCGITVAYAVRCGLQARFERFVFLQRALLRDEFENGERRDHAQVVRPQHAHEALCQLGQLVVELVAQAPHQEGEAFKEPFNMRITFAHAVHVQFTRAIGECLRELLAGFAQVAHFCLVVAQDLVISGWLCHVSECLSGNVRTGSADLRW
jgi:hypothetical protein